MHRHSHSNTQSGAVLRVGMPLAYWMPCIQLVRRKALSAAYCIRVSLLDAWDRFDKDLGSSAPYVNVCVSLAFYPCLKPTLRSLGASSSTITPYCSQSIQLFALGTAFCHDCIV